MNAETPSFAFWGGIAAQLPQSLLLNFMWLLHVATRTIRKDITALSLTVPLLTVRGRYGGGIELADWFHPYAKMLAPEQEELLQRIQPSLAGEDLIVMNSILAQFGSSHGYQLTVSTAP